LTTFSLKYDDFTRGEGPRLCLQVFQFHDQPSVREVCRFLNFSYKSFISPILIYKSSL
jgi:hypothetical protein